jgi:hypothetical protein
MQISYDDDGRILAVSPIEGVLTGENILSIRDDSVPDDLLESIALGRYIVRKGKLEQSKSSHERPDDDASNISAIFPDLQPGKKKRK